MRLSATSLIRLVTVVVEKTVQLVMSVADFFFVLFFWLRVFNPFLRSSTCMCGMQQCECILF